MPSRDDDGYASVTALVLCAALSLVCAGVLSMTHVQSKRAARDLKRTADEEAMNTALIRFGMEVMQSSAPDRLEKTGSLGEGGDLKLTADNEQLKWPLNKAAELSEVQLKHKARLELASLLPVIAAAEDGQRPRNDCVRSLFSSYGYAALEGNVTTGGSVIAQAQARDGQVWRLKALAGAQVEERLVRFTGDSHKPFAVISRETYTLSEMPLCTDLIRP